MKNSSDNVFGPISVGPDEAALVAGYLGDHDFAANTRRAVVQDLRKFAAWFSAANAEPFVVGRVTTRDITDFKDSLRREQGQAVATINRALVTLRRFFGWLVEKGHVPGQPGQAGQGTAAAAACPEGHGTERGSSVAARNRACGRMFGRMRSSSYSYTPVAGSAIWWPWNSTT